MRSCGITATEQEDTRKPFILLTTAMHPIRCQRVYEWFVEERQTNEEAEVLVANGVPTGYYLTAAEHLNGRVGFRAYDGSLRHEYRTVHGHRRPARRDRTLSRAYSH